VLLDSTIIIYAADDHEGLRRLIASQPQSVSAISVVEVLGTIVSRRAALTHFEEFFRESNLPGVSDRVISVSVKLRQQRKISCGFEQENPGAVGSGMGSS